MGKGQLQITTKHHNQINLVFGNKLRETGIIDVWPNTIADEQNELDTLLLSQPTVNDVIEYLDNKIIDWKIAIETIHEASTSYRAARSLIDCYETLIAYVGRIS